RSISALDSVGALILWQACEGQPPAHVELRHEHAPLFRRWRERSPDDDRVRFRHETLMDRLAKAGRSGVSHVTGLLALTGQVTLDTLALASRPRQFPLKDLSATIYQAGVKALGITALVGFLIGIVLSYLSSLQLRSFGAEVFIVNILGLAIIRELGPLLAAILVAGRSGSAMAAQLGMMRLTEELDALTVMGIPHSVRLVLPKLAALAIAMPLLVLWTDVMALIGGMLSAKAALGISLNRFIEMLPNVVPIANLWIGLGKSVVFGLLIAMIACHFGLRIKPNTESLGLETTNAVVTSITLVILADAVFAIVFRGVGVAS
ncbi:MAG: ABC transporter permease, partial [Marinobacter sp.]|nr:ABC transporter permease [Marinobacter sp.]